MVRPATMTVGALGLVSWLISIALPNPQSGPLGIPIGIIALWPVWAGMAVVVGTFEIVVALTDRGHEPDVPSDEPPEAESRTRRSGFAHVDVSLPDSGTRS